MSHDHAPHLDYNNCWYQTFVPCVPLLVCLSKATYPVIIWILRILNQLYVIDTNKRQKGQTAIDTSVTDVLELYYSRGLLATRTSGFIPIKTVPWLHLTVNEKIQRQCTQQATIGAVRCGSFFNLFSNSGELCSTSLMLIFSDKSFYNCWPHVTLKFPCLGLIKFQ